MIIHPVPVSIVCTLQGSNFSLGDQLKRVSWVCEVVRGGSSVLRCGTSGGSMCCSVGR